jgi:FAD-dependent oxidoreductase domain-containing protein 1
MLLIQRNRCTLQAYASRKFLSSSSRCLKDDKEQQAKPTTVPFAEMVSDYKRTEHPAARTKRIIGNDFKRVGNWFKDKMDFFRKLNPEQKRYPVPIESIDHFIQNRESTTLFQSHCDVLVIGGGGIGSSIAYWLKKRAQEGLNVVVVEKDPTYEKASTPLSLGGLRQQFSLVENIQMSLYGSDFIRNIKEHLGDDVDVNFTPYGYLMLATEEMAEGMKRNSRLQNELGARNEILTARRLKEKFPWLNTDGIELGCHGLEKEGWFDPWTLLYSMKKRAIEHGAHYVNGEVTGFEFRKQEDMLVEGVEAGTYESVDRVLVKMPDGSVEPIKFGICVIAAGANSGEIGKMARMGTGSGMLSIPLPIEPRKRYVYAFGCDEDKPESGSTLNTPLVVDPSNVYFRREGLSGLYVGGRSPECIEKEPSCENLDVDYDYFDTEVWPHLAHRVPKFEAIKVKSAWAGFYEYNTFDENGIVGPHPYYHNLYIASGFSGHGELILHNS